MTDTPYIIDSLSMPYILYIPDVALEKIFSFFTYDEIAGLRLVSKKFNEVSSRLLTRGFLKLEKRCGTLFKQVKSVLPRRESERRAHPLARHCDILQAIETRISMLNMTYMKYIENNLLCFIPGKVLDEMQNVMRIVEHCNTPPRTHQLLQELRDLSSMAMEHFDENILPRVREQMDHKTAIMAASTCTPSSSKLSFAHQILSNEIHKVQKQNKIHKHHITFLTQNNQKLNKKIRRQNIRIMRQTLKLREQDQRIQEQTAKIQEQENTIAEIKKHMDEWDQKYTDLTTELVRARDDILSKASPNQTATPVSSPSTSRPKFYVSNIKPRAAVLPKFYVSHPEHQKKLKFNKATETIMQSDCERKRRSLTTPDIPTKLFVYENDKTDDSIHSDTPPKVSNEFCVKEPFKDDENGDDMLVNNQGLFGHRNLSTIINSSLEKILNPSNITRKRKLSEAFIN